MTHLKNEISQKKINKPVDTTPTLCYNNLTTEKRNNTMTTITTSLSIQKTDNNDLVRDLFAEGTEASAHTWFKAIRCLVNTVTKLDSASKKLALNPDTDGVLVYKKSIADKNGKGKTEWGFDLGEYYVTYKSALSGQSRIMKGDEIVFEGPWPELKAFLKPADAPKAEKKAPKAEVKVAAAPVIEPPAEVAQDETEDEDSDEGEIENAKTEDDKVEDLIAELNGEDEQAPSGQFWVRNGGNYWDADEAERLGVTSADEFEMAL